MTYDGLGRVVMVIPTYNEADNLAWIVGPGIAGLLLATGDLVAAFVLNALSFTLIGLITKLLSDLSYVWADPRVKFD